MSLLISLQSELIKIKRTSTLKLCLIAASIIPLLIFFDSIEVGPKTPINRPWIDYFISGHDELNVVFFPLYIVLITTLLLQTEYRDRTWKQVLTSPQKLINIFLAKFITLHILILLISCLLQFFDSYRSRRR